MNGHLRLEPLVSVSGVFAVSGGFPSVGVDGPSPGPGPGWLDGGPLHRGEIQIPLVPGPLLLPQPLGRLSAADRRETHHQLVARREGSPSGPDRLTCPQPDPPCSSARRWTGLSRPEQRRDTSPRSSCPGTWRMQSPCWAPARPPERAARRIPGRRTPRRRCSRRAGPAETLTPRHRHRHRHGEGDGMG